MRAERIGAATLCPGDCLQVLAGMPEASVDAVVTDPPYHLTSIVKRFGKEGAAPAKSNGATGVYGRAAAGFMGKTWDGGDIAFRPELWAECLRVLKPGGFIASFSSTRTYHRMACALEDAGFIVHPMLGWVFGSGFPKATRVDAEGYDGVRYGLQALKPALEPIFLGQKPFSEKTGTANVLRWGTGGLNIAACRVGTTGGGQNGRAIGALNREQWRQPPVAAATEDTGRWPPNLLHDGSPEVLAAFEVFGERGGGDKRGQCAGRRPGGFGNVGTAKGEGTPNAVVYADQGTPARFFPALGYEPGELRFWYSGKASRRERNAGLDSLVSIVITEACDTNETRGASLARLLVDTGRLPLRAIAESGIGRKSVIEWSTSWFGNRLTDLFLEECRSTTSTATSSTIVSAILRSLIRYLTSESTAVASCETANGGSHAASAERGTELTITISAETASRLGVGSAASPTRLRISASAAGNIHSTVKPLALCRWLVRLITPPNGVVLDCFAGSGSVGVAALQEGMRPVLIEREAEYVDIARRRLEAAVEGFSLPLLDEEPDTVEEEAA